MRKEIDHNAIMTRIEQLRLSRGLKKASFCRLIKMNPQTYNNFVGKQGSRPSVDLIFGVRQAFPNITYDWLLEGKNGPDSPPHPKPPYVVAVIGPHGATTQHTFAASPKDAMSKVLEDME